MRKTLTREELLVLLMEECAEVIQAASKCIRFGWDHDQPGYGINYIKLATELGELDAVIDALCDQHMPSTATEAYSTANRHKMARAEAVLAELGRRHAP